MDYYKIVIVFSPFEEWAKDILEQQLAEIGFESFVDFDSGFEAYIPVKNFDENFFHSILSDIDEKFEVSLMKEVIKSRNWNEVWEKNYFEPLVISNKCLIRAPFHKDYPQCEYEIIIEPNMAFGTGNHETTSMMVEVILGLDLEGKSVLDMGCGTGILSIMASLKGAKNITAIDIDEWSFNGTTENAELNNIQNIEPLLGDASSLGNKSFDVIFANIHKNVLLNDIPSYNSVLNTGGTLIMSGFYKEDMADIKAKAESMGLEDAGFKTKNNWVAYSFLKKG